MSRLINPVAEVEFSLFITVARDSLPLPLP
jgi:hypothetical protein